MRRILLRARAAVTTWLYPADTRYPSDTSYPKDSSAYPAEVLFPSNPTLWPWYLGLPIDSSGGTSGNSDSIYQPALATYSNSSWFYADGNGGVVFRANAGGATTSGSSYPRSELREMKASNPVAPVSTNGESWGLNDGKTHTLTVVCKPSKGTLVNKPQVVIGQIHDTTATNGDLIEILLTAPPSTSDSAIALRINGPTQSTRLVPSFTDGSSIVYRIVAGSNRIKVYAASGTSAAALPGTPQFDIDVTTVGFTNLSTIQAGDCYFKVGAYVQSNDSAPINENPAAYGENVVTSIDVSHV